MHTPISSEGTTVLPTLTTTVLLQFQMIEISIIDISLKLDNTDETQG